MIHPRPASSVQGWKTIHGFWLGFRIVIALVGFDGLVSGSEPKPTNFVVILSDDMGISGATGERFEPKISIALRATVCGSPSSTTPRGAVQRVQVS
jgi:hypothetical protein